MWMVGIFAFVQPKDNPVSGKAIKRPVCIHQQAIAASFQENNLVIDWVNAQPILPVLTCLGDGHDGIWNIISHFAPDQTRPEVLDWFHLMENLHKVGGSLKRLKQAKNFLWKGQVSEAIAKERSAFSNRPLR